MMLLKRQMLIKRRDYHTLFKEYKYSEELRNEQKNLIRNMQDDIEHCTGKRGCYSKLRTSVCSYNRIQSLSKHIERNAKRNVEEVFLGMSKRLCINSSSEHGNDLIAENHIYRAKNQAADNYHNY